MNDLNDQQLLRDYASRQTEAAFAELVRRHIDLVYSAALRMVCDPHLAEDVAQGAFVALARNASRLTDRTVLSGWLHRTAQNIAAQSVRTDVRRRAREQEAAAMNDLLATEPAAAWEIIAPQLDAALAELAEPDRDALLLRYFERKSAHEMARQLGISDEAAQKRVSRAVERLRELFAKRGVAVGAGGLAAGLAANAIQAAPVGLAAAIASAATLVGTGVATTVAVTALKTIAMTTLQKTLVTVTLAAALGTGAYEARQAASLQTRVQILQQQQAPLSAQLAELQQTRETANRRLAALIAENTRLNQNQEELLRLRGEVTMLQRNAAAPALATAVADTSANGGPSPEDLGRDLGLAVVRGDPGAMQQLRDLSEAEHATWATNSVGVDNNQMAQLARSTFAPLNAAFNVIADAAAKGNQSALEAVKQAIQIPVLHGQVVVALGTIAASGNNDALNTLLNYQQYDLPFPGVVGALEPAASQGNQQAIAFLAAVAQEPSQHSLWYMVAAGLGPAAALGNPLAVDTLITLASDSDQSIQSVARSGLRQAAANQNTKAANALQTLGYK